MKFPLATLNKTEYLEKIKSLLEDEECQIFFDTNIYALFFKIYSSARQEFFSWVNELHDKQRVHSPLWILNEYSNRFVRDKIEDYFSPLKKITTTQKELKEISSFLKMNIDAASLTGTTYSSVQDYVNDLNLVEETFKKITKATKTKDQAYKNTIHDEIKSTFEKTVLKSNLENIFNKIGTVGSFRYNHKFPPGFEDGTKALNEFGDLIIWHEILEFCKSSDKKKAILITNDNKKDWMYAPSILIEGTRKKPNSQPFLNIADPRLVFEFFQYTQSEEFYIINFETLTRIVINNSSGRFIELAKALQIVYEQNLSETQSDEVTNENVLIEEMPSEEVLNNDTIQTLVSEPEVIYEIPTATAKVELVLKYSESALADAKFPLEEDSSFLTYTIIKLKSTNWHIQNPALTNFIINIALGIEETQENSDKLFVVGRNIYQAACGGAYGPVDFIGELESYFSKYGSFISNNLYSGMLYEVYFDSHNLFRIERFKGFFINELLKLQSNELLIPSFEFIRGALTPFKDRLFILPNHNPEKIKVDIKFEEEEINLDFFNGRYNLISGIEINNKAVLSDTFEDLVEGFFRFEGKLDVLLQQISLIYLVPTSQMDVHLSKGNAELVFELPKGYNFIKLSRVNP